MWTFELHCLSIARISLWEPQPKTLWPQPRGCVIFSLFYSPLYGSNSQAISTPRSIENGLVTAAINRNDLLTDQSISWQPRYLMSRGQMTTNEGVRWEKVPIVWRFFAVEVKNWLISMNEKSSDPQIFCSTAVSCNRVTQARIRFHLTKISDEVLTGLSVIHLQ